MMFRFQTSACAAAILSLWANAHAAPSVLQDEAAVVVTATRFEDSPAALAGGGQVITADQIARSSATSLPEVLAKLGGIHVRNNAGSPNWQIDMRGFGMSGDQNTLILLDGQRLSENELTSAVLSSIPLDAVARIEILRGSGAVMYGGGATAGAINIITRGARLDGSRGTLAVSAGDYGTQDLRASLNLARDNQALFFSANQYDSNNYRRNNRDSESNAEGEWRYYGDRGGWRVRFGGSHQTLEFPAERTALQLTTDPRGTRTPEDNGVTDLWHAGVSGNYHLADVELMADLGIRDKHAVSDFVSMGEITDTRTRTWTFSPRVRLPHGGPGGEAELVAGIDHADWEFRTQDTFTGRGEARQQRDAFYIQEQARLSAETRLTAGARWERVEDRFSLPAQQSRIRDVSAWELRLNQGIGAGWSAYGKVGKSYRLATVNENYDVWSGTIAFLRPQTSRDAEFGAEFTSAPLRARAGYFRSNLTDEIHYLVVPGPGFFSAYAANTNLSPTRREGVELDAQWRPVAGLELSGNYRRTLARFRSGTYAGVDLTDKEVPLVPRHLLTFNAAWSMADGGRLSGTLRHVGEQRYDNDQTNGFRTMPSYTLLDLKYSRQLGAWTLSGAVDNVTDKRYYSYGIRNNAGTSFNAYPELGRRFMATAEVRFD